MESFYPAFPRFSPPFFQPFSQPLSPNGSSSSSSPSPAHFHAYELYTRLPDLSAMWKAKLWPDWTNEEALRPALHALELTFRLISAAACDTRPYMNRGEWMNRLESLVVVELEVISQLCQGDDLAPTTTTEAVHTFGDRESTELVQWPSGLEHVVNMSSQESLLLKMACCDQTRHVVNRIYLAVESQMSRAPFTLGIGEPNLLAKPVLCYDAVCSPRSIYECKPPKRKDAAEDHTLCTLHQIVESWMAVSESLLHHIHRFTTTKTLSASDLSLVACLACMVDRIWKLASSTMNLLLLTDPSDFLKLKRMLAIDFASGGPYCLRSRRLMSVTNACKDLADLVPNIAGVEADPKGGPRLQDALMTLLLQHGSPHSAASGIHVLQAFQSIESSTKQFYFEYRQLVISVMGSASATSALEAIAQIYFEPSYFPSLDGAKIFVDHYWHYHPTTEEGSTIPQVLSNQRKIQKSGISNGCMSIADSSNITSRLCENENMKDGRSQW